MLFYFILCITNTRFLNRSRLSVFVWDFCWQFMCTILGMRKLARLGRVYSVVYTKRIYNYIFNIYYHSMLKYRYVNVDLYVCISNLLLSLTIYTVYLYDNTVICVSVHFDFTSHVTYSGTLLYRKHYGRVTLLSFKVCVSFVWFERTFLRVLVFVSL